MSNLQTSKQSNECTSIWTIFWQFLLLGCTSFGGPAAHIGYFRNQFVDRLGWLTDKHYSEIVALSQVLPGPGSSQVGFSIGLEKRGVPGGIAAFLGFTLPSFVIMYLLAVITLSELDQFYGVISGLKLLAVVVVLDACLGMFNNFCKTRLLKVIACFAAAILLLLPGLTTQFTVLIIAAIVANLFYIPSLTEDKVKHSNTFLTPNLSSLIIFIVIFILALLIAKQIDLVDIFYDFYLAGSLVFGGGHVVLPLLQESVTDTIGQDSFITGYAGAQAIPGPMFALASYLGAELNPHHPLLGASVATIAIFLPGFLLILAFKSSWQSIMANPKFYSASQGINAAVVGLLLAALYDPIWTSAVHQASDVAAIIFGLMLLKQFKLHIMYLVAGFIGIGWVFY